MANSYYTNTTYPLSRALNLLALAGICGILLFAFIWQFAFNDLPCPLCLLQRVAFVMIGIGLLLNLRFGPSAMHYGMIILSALGGAFAAGRQVLLHIGAGDPGYGPPFMGLHFYTWALIFFIAFLGWTAIMLIVDRRCSDQPNAQQVSRIARSIMWVFLILVAGNMVSTLLECGFGACPDDPVSYLWLQ